MQRECRLCEGNVKLTMGMRTMLGECRIFDRSTEYARGIQNMKM